MTDHRREEKMGKKKRKGAAKVAAALQSGSFPYHPEEEYIDKVRPIFKANVWWVWC